MITLINSLACDTLETINKGLSDDSKSLLLVSSLSPSYSNFVDDLIYGRQTLTLEKVKAVLNTKALQEKLGNMDNREGLTVNGRTDKNGRKKMEQSKTKTKPNNL